MNELSIGDVLVFKSLHCDPVKNVSDKPTWSTCGRLSTVSETQLNTLRLVNLLQQCAIENLKIFRQRQVRNFNSLATVVTTDFEALYAYKHGDYQQCLQLSTQNVRTLLKAVRMADVLIFPEFIQLLDDDIVSLTALTLIVHPECRGHNVYVYITQLTLSLYLMTQCQLKLRHSVTSLAQTMDYIEVAQRRIQLERTLDHLTLKLNERKLKTYQKIIVSNVRLK